MKYSEKIINTDHEKIRLTTFGWRADHSYYFGVKYLIAPAMPTLDTPDTLRLREAIDDLSRRIREFEEQREACKRTLEFFLAEAARKQLVDPKRDELMKKFSTTPSLLNFIALLRGSQMAKFNVQELARASGVAGRTIRNRVVLLMPESTSFREKYGVRIAYDKKTRDYVVSGI